MNHLLTTDELADIIARVERDTLAPQDASILLAEVITLRHMRETAARSLGAYLDDVHA